jgi:hypothetical protein
MKKLSISTPWKEVKENEYKRISSFRPLPEVTLESIDTDEVPDVDFVEVGEVQSLEEERSSFESVLKSLNQQKVSEFEEEPTTIIETEPQKPVSFFSDYDFEDETTEGAEPTVEEEPVAQEETSPKPKFSLDYLFKKTETDKTVSPEIEDTDETKTPDADESNDDVDTSIFGDEFGLSEEDEDEEPDYSSENDETEEDGDDSDNSVDTSAFDDDEDDELEEDEDEDFDYSSESDDESVDLSKFEEDDEEDEDEEPDYSSEDDFEDEEPESDSSVNTINWGDDTDELEDEEPDYSSEDEPVITETSETDVGYLPSVDEVTTEVFNVISIANKVYEYQQPVKHHKHKNTTIAKPVVSHPKPKTTTKTPIYDTEPVDDLVTFTRKRVRVSELDLLKIYSKKELEQALREGKVLRKKGIIIFAHA